MTLLRGVMVGIGAWLAAYFTGIIPVAIVLMAANLIDYGMGIIAASKRGEKISSAKAFAGIKKKVTMYLIVAVGLFLDFLVFYVLKGQFNIELPLDSIFGVFVCVWLILEELLSILENASEIGVNIPFLQPAIKLLQKYVITKTKIEKEQTDE